MATRTYKGYHRSIAWQSEHIPADWQSLSDELMSWFWLAVVVGLVTGVGKLLFALLMHELELH